jgi:hypothetical protein
MVRISSIFRSKWPRLGKTRDYSTHTAKARKPAHEERTASEKNQVSKEAVHAVYSMGRAAGLSDEKLHRACQESEARRKLKAPPESALALQREFSLAWGQGD